MLLHYNLFQVAAKLAPYLKLYNAATDFLNKQRKWMDGAVGTHDPDAIEAEVGTASRTIYKLKKSFTNEHETLRLIDSVSDDH